MYVDDAVRALCDVADAAQSALPAASII